MALPHYPLTDIARFYISCKGNLTARIDGLHLDQALFLLHVHGERLVRQGFVAIVDLQRADGSIGPRVHRIDDVVSIHGIVHMAVHVDIGETRHNDESRIALEFLKKECDKDSICRFLQGRLPDVA